MAFAIEIEANEGVITLARDLRARDAAGDLDFNRAVLDRAERHRVLVSAMDQRVTAASPHQRGLDFVIADREQVVHLSSAKRRSTRAVQAPHAPRQAPAADLA